MVKFNKDLLPEQIPKRQFGDKTELVTISYLCNPGNACKLEDKVIHFRILSCTLGTPTTMAKLLLQQPKNKELAIAHLLITDLIF